MYDSEPTLYKSIICVENEDRDKLTDKTEAINKY